MENAFDTVPTLRRKLVAVGDGASGKSCLLITFAHGYFPISYVPTVFSDYYHPRFATPKNVSLALWDTAGQEDYDRLRPLSYPETDIVLICYGIDMPDSLENVKTKWIAEVKHFCPTAPILLVGCKRDLRMDMNVIMELRRSGYAGTVQWKEGEDMARAIGALRYMECSAKYNDGVTDVFEEAARIAIGMYDRHDAANASRKKRKVRCTIL
ncbi:GTP-binding protein of the rho subfamily of ras-like protein [Ramicandelaber brevisporus]|nr:GTP-binding protein of the rho subfamily of ras-like protein [Ramicandelaber brevisporus]